MKNTVLTLTAITLAAVSAPAMAGTIQAEARFGDVRNGQSPDSTEFKIDYTAPLNSFLNYGAELTVKQKEDEGDLSSKISARVGPALPTVAGFHTDVFGEVGRSLSTGNNFDFWGAGVKTTRDVVGPVSVTLGYRHREGFNNVNYVENRLQGGLGLKLSEANKATVTYYRYTGTDRRDSIGVGISHSF